SVVGLDHLKAARNGHDAFHIEIDGERMAAVISDGCGSAPRSEVGAAIGARVFAQELLKHGSDWDAASHAALERLAEIARAIGGSFEDTIRDSFLFTIVAAAIGEIETTILSCGDGVFAVNGITTTIGPYPGNAPPYMGYALLGGNVRLRVERTLPTSHLQSLILGTDGAAQLELAMLTADDRLFRNRDAVRRTLFAMTRRPPLLHDDTTLVLLRRTKWAA
ncbi:MAG: protein phosphatase 2C domain-containing protein, partial [Thermoanaerobaculia bacterium]